MGAGTEVARDRPVFHTLSEETFGSLVHDGDPEDLIGELRRAERSRRLLFLRALLDRADESGVPEALTLHEAWSLLERAQRVAPGPVEDVLTAPGTGVWVTAALRRLRDGSEGEPPLWAVTGHLSALAVAAATRARLTFSLDVPAYEGTVPLPGLGCVTLREKRLWSLARATGRDGALCVSLGGTEVRVGPDWQRPAAGWRPARRLVLGPRESSLWLVLEDQDPYRAYSGPQGPRILPEAEASAWESSLSEAWTILRRDQSTVAEAMRRGGLVSIAPATTRERFRPYSSSAGEAFGGIRASLPDCPAQLAVTLVHEFQHIKLGAVIHLDPLLHRAEAVDEHEELFYAPWRDDPRPLEGLLQGIYAFFGVTRFWRSHRLTPVAERSPLADFEFALSREQVSSALNAVRRHGRLTPVGERLLERMSRHCVRWLTEDVPGEALRLAHDVRDDHQARWRVYHLRPPADAVEETARAWRRGDTRPPDRLATQPLTVPGPEAVCLDTAAVLARHHVVAARGGRRDMYEPSVRGAGPADLLLAQGEREAARRLLTEQLLDAGHPPSAWALLGRALAGDTEHRAASRFLLRFPERARAVQEALEIAHGDRADPVRLASWLAGGAGQD